MKQANILIVIAALALFGCDSGSTGPDTSRSWIMGGILELLGLGHPFSTPCYMRRQTE